jgi:hypothetical protein
MKNMRERTQKRGAPLVITAAALSLAIGALVHTSVAAQQAPAAPAAPNAQAAASIDLTGTWVSVVTEDWRWRMVTPPKGDYSSVPVNAAARQVGDTWDPAKDTAAGLACKSYGAAAIMRVPTRVQISWQDNNTMKMDIDAGTQTRLFHFGDATPPAGADAGWQGFSTAAWEPAGGARGGGGAGGAGGGGGGGGAAPAPAAGAPAAGAPAAAAPAAGGGGGGRGGRGGGGGGRAGGPAFPGGDLKVETTKLRPGYLRKNGVPYDEKTTVQEFYDRHTEPNGDVWFTVTTIVKDPTYLTGDFITSTHFKKEADASKWRPTACTAS